MLKDMLRNIPDDKKRKKIIKSYFNIRQYSFEERRKILKELSDEGII